MKYCSNKNCENKNKLLSPDQFYKKTSSKSGLDSRCKSCVNKYKQIYNNTEQRKEKSRLYELDPVNKERRQRRTKEYRKDSTIKQNLKEQKRKWSLQTLYSKTMDDYKAMLTNQDHKCKICKVSELNAGKYGLVVDHSHDTNIVRGLLCNNCNSALGLLKENIASMKNAIIYIQQDGKI